MVEEALVEEAPVEGALVEGEANDSGIGLLNVATKVAFGVLAAMATLSGIAFVSKAFRTRKIESLKELYGAITDEKGQPILEDELEEFLNKRPEAMQQLIGTCEIQLDLLDKKDDRDLREKVRHLRDNLKRASHEALAGEHAKAAKAIGGEGEPIFTS